MLLLGGGMGITFVPLTMASLQNVRPEDYGVAASMVNVTQQVGGALGLAILVTVYGHATSTPASHRAGRSAAIAQAHQVLAHGMASSFAVAAIFDVCALLVITIAIRMRRAASAEAVPAPARSART